MKPLEGTVVLDFSQYLAGPSAALRLADLGARVIKVENPKTGDNARQLSLNNLYADGDSVNFYTINRNKESFAANLKDAGDREMVKKLIAKADVLIENFRPGVMEKFGLDYENARKINRRIVYASVTGYGTEGPWKKKPGQDLLIQSLSGLAYLNGNADQPPMPFAVSIVDTVSGAHLVQGILACLIRRAKTGEGGNVEISLLESILSFEVEAVTVYLNNGRRMPERSGFNNAHAALGAPYGIYETKNGYLALTMGSVVRLGEILGCRRLTEYTDPEVWFTKRDEIKKVLQEHLKQEETGHWMSLLEKAGYWASEVMNWEQMTSHEAFRVLDFVQDVHRPGQPGLLTTRCPIRVDGKMLKSEKWAPKLGEDNEKIISDFHLKGEEERRI
ncbi:CoA transferase [Caproiciproducens sp. NJN-50]|uniref:CaiB/BaiF CoA transferase family protein n=1 Tax=Acutalibacteraceae TaxID=3082771 RepID=UPI000FFE26C2|nr:MULTISPECIES: CoA transferase [Acutalibacteraceae]QAT50086.1 CoA transferase [Caproiciproducens sp. NJN-50]